MPAGSADLDELSKNGNLQLLESVSGRHIGCLIPVNRKCPLLAHSSRSNIKHECPLPLHFGCSNNPH